MLSVSAIFVKSQNQYVYILELIMTKIYKYVSDWLRYYIVIIRELMECLALKKRRIPLCNMYRCQFLVATSHQ